MARHLPWTCGPSVSPSEYGVTITDSKGRIVASTYHEHSALLAAAPEIEASRDRLRGALRQLVDAAEERVADPNWIPLVNARRVLSAT